MQNKKLIRTVAAVLLVIMLVVTIGASFLYLLPSASAYSYAPGHVDTSVLVDSVQAKYERISGKTLSGDNRLKLFRAYRTKYAESVLSGEIISTKSENGILTINFRPENPRVKIKSIQVELSEKLIIPKESSISEYSRIILHVEWEKGAIENGSYRFKVIASAIR